MNSFSVSSFSALILCFSLLTAYEEVADKAELKILTPGISERKTAKIRLDNGLEAYLVSDPKSEEAGLAITMRAGSWDEPEGAPGLAHFLEHMLFLGTKTYPNESEYSAFLASYGGTTNAFTYNDITAYLFSIRKEGFVEAVDRFSSFFKEPLFNPSGVGREVKAIDQEFRIHAEDNNFITYQVLKELSNPKHPFSKFNTGNEISLKDASQDELKKWYKALYSSDQMRLWVFSPLPLDEMKSLIEKDFGTVVKSDKVREPIVEDVLSPNVLGKMVAIEPIKEEVTLTLLWELPTSFTQWKEETPWKVLCYVLGDEGETSILAQLKREGLAQALACAELVLSDSKLFFLIDVDLTEKGLLERNKVAERIFQGLARIQEKGISKELFEELQTLQKMKFQWTTEKQVFDVAMDRAFDQGYESLDTYPDLTVYTKKYDAEKIQQLLSELTPQKAVYILLAPSKKSGLSYPLKEKWTQTAYGLFPFDVKSLEGIKPFAAIDLPSKNIFIPASLQAKLSSNLDVWKGVPEVKTIADSPKGKLYYLEDTIYGTPSFYGSFELRTPVISDQIPQSIVFRDLLIAALEDSLDQITYEAKVAGLDLDIGEGEEGIKFVFSGYHDKASVLIEHLVDAMTLPNLTEETFNLLFEDLKRQYRNFQRESPIKQAKELLEEAIYAPYVTEKQKEMATKGITYEKFRKFLERVWVQTYTEGVLLGDLKESQAQLLWKIWTKSIGKKAYPEDKQKKPNVVTWPQKGGPFVLKKKTHAKGSALILTLEDPDFSQKKRAAQQILQLTIDNEFFNELRTKQQTGYAVGYRTDELDKKLFDSFYVQSSTHTPQELIWRVETFIESFAQALPEWITEEQFERARASLVATLKDRPKSFDELGALITKLAFTLDGDFKWMEKRVEGFKELTYEEFLTLSRETLGRSNRRRLAILVEGANKKSFTYQPQKSADLLKQNSPTSK